MALSIVNNASSLNAQRNLSMAQGKLGTNFRRLSSGLRISVAADDAAGLAVSEKMRAQIGGLNQATRNAQDGISMIQTAEGGMSETHAMMQRMRELAVQASNDTLTDADRAFMATEITELRSEINDIADRTEFNGKALLTGALSSSVDATSPINEGFVVVAGTNTSLTGLDVSKAAAGTTFTLTASSADLTISDGTNSQTVTLSDIAADSQQTYEFDSLGISLTVSSVAGDAGADVAAGLIAGATDTIVTASGSGSATLQTGANAGETLTVSFGDVQVNSSNSNSAMSGLDSAITTFSSSSTRANASALITAVDSAINYVSSQRATLGANQNRLEYTVANLATTAENMTASESRIRDVDVASETAAMSRAQVLSQAGVAVLAQANQAPQLALRLLG